MMPNPRPNSKMNVVPDQPLESAINLTGLSRMDPYSDFNKPDSNYGTGYNTSAMNTKRTVVPPPIDNSQIQSPVLKKEMPPKMGGSTFSAIGQQSLNKSRKFGDAVLNSNTGTSNTVQSGGYDVNKKFQPSA